VSSLTGAAVCPSYQVTGEELHSTRGRARLLQGMMVGDVVDDGWESTEVLEALDLCLSCKAYVSDCPVEVDVVTYKAEFFHQHYTGRRRPPSHYSMVAAGLAPARAGRPGLGNRLFASRPLASALKRLGGIAHSTDRERCTSPRSSTRRSPARRKAAVRRAAREPISRRASPR
jgi:Fe-S oxidoreductase